MPTRSVPDSPVLILHLEDDSADAELIRQTLTTADLPAVVTLARSRAEFASALEQTAFHVVLSDYSLPEFDGTAALALARELAPDVPFIIVSGALDEETAVRLVLAGATDYVLKNRLRRLGPAVHRALREARERQARRSAERALESRARQQAVIAELGLQALGGLPLPELMETLARQVAATLAIEYTKVLELQPDGQTLRVGAPTAMARPATP
jgi:DNA-binding NtrC family response regulator